MPSVLPWQNVARSVSPEPTAGAGGVEGLVVDVRLSVVSCSVVVDIVSSSLVVVGRLVDGFSVVDFTGSVGPLVLGAGACVSSLVCIATA